MYDSHVVSEWYVKAFLGAHSDEWGSLYVSHFAYSLLALKIESRNRQRGRSPRLP